MIKKAVLTALLSGSFHLLRCQVESNINALIENRIEFLSTDEENTSTDYSQFAEMLHQFHENPINLNEANRKELQRLGLMQNFQVEALISYISQYGQLIRIEELQAIPGFDRETILRITPFVYVGEYQPVRPATADRLEKSSSSQLFLRIQRTMEQQKGYDPQQGAYMGSPDKLYCRYAFNMNNRFRLGLTTEKDPGEAFFKESQKAGFDFYSAYLAFFSKDKSNTLIVGDFHVQFGHGLTVWTVNGNGKSSDVLQIKRSAPLIAPSTAANESGFMRGAGASIDFGKNWSGTTFLSYSPVDANIEDDQIISLPKTGLHRTASEIESKNRLRKLSAGSRIEKYGRRLHTGVSFLSTSLTGRTTLKPGLRFHRAGADFDLHLKKATLFGEYAMDRSLSKALVAGLLMSPDRDFQLGLFHRQADKDYDPEFANALMENSTVQNENGTYISSVISLLKKARINAYYDVFRFPWLKYQVDAPSGGTDYLVQFDYQFSKKLQALVRTKRKSKGKNQPSEGTALNQIQQETTVNWRYELGCQVNDLVNIKSRVETKRYSFGPNAPEHGIVILQDIRLGKEGKPFALTLRHVMFHTGSFNSRIYANENDVLYAFSIPAYYGRGKRYYAMIRYRISKHLTVWLRYARTYFDDRMEIGSGNDLINGNTKSEAKLQLRLAF